MQRLKQYFLYLAGVDGGWGEWGPFQHCIRKNKKCERTRARKCDNPLKSNGGANCIGASSESKPCTANMCGNFLFFIQIIMLCMDIIIYWTHSCGYIHYYFLQAVLQTHIRQQFHPTDFQIFVRKSSHAQCQHREESVAKIIYK